MSPPPPPPEKIQKKENVYDLKTIASFSEKQICGVIGGHSTSTDGFRFRGLYVFPKYRGKGLSKKLFKKLQECAHRENRSYIWSFPKKSAWFAYEKFGFELSGAWLPGEDEMNAFAFKKIKQCLHSTKKKKKELL